MNSVFWIISILCGWVAMILVVSAIVAAVARRSGTGVLIAAIAGLAVIVSGFWLRMPLLLILVSIAAYFAGNHVLRKNTRNAQHASQSTKLAAAHITLLAGSFLFLLPFAWLLSTSLKPDDEMAVFPPRWIPTQQVAAPNRFKEDGKPAGMSTYTPPTGGAPFTVIETQDLPTGEVIAEIVTPAERQGDKLTVKRQELTKIRAVSPRWENYSEALAFLPAETNYGLVFLRNTLFLTMMTVLGTVLSSSVVAYSFARLNWPGKEIWFGVLLATMMIPGAVTMMPQFLIFRYLGWYDTLNPLWVPAFFGSAFNIFLLRQFFMSIPGELEDAAKIDGCGPFGIYWRVMLPLVKPALAAISIMGVLGAWNNFQGPLIYLSSPDKMPLAYALQLYQTQHGGEPGLMMAASTMVVLPIIVLFFFTQRYFIEGVSLSGMGGR